MWNLQSAGNEDMSAELLKNQRYCSTREAEILNDLSHRTDTKICRLLVIR